MYVFLERPNRSIIIILKVEKIFISLGYNAIVVIQTLGRYVTTLTFDQTGNLAWVKTRVMSDDDRHELTPSNLTYIA